MTRLGLTRVKDTLDGHTIALPANLMIVGDSGRGVLTQAASQLGYTVIWVDEENRASELQVPYQIRPGDCGPALIGGRVRSIERRTTHEGVIVAHDTSTEVYTIQFQDFTTQLLTARQEAFRNKKINVLVKECFRAVLLQPVEGMRDRWAG
jgi:hypothetical protein